MYLILDGSQDCLLLLAVSETGRCVAGQDPLHGAPHAALLTKDAGKDACCF